LLLPNISPVYQARKELFRHISPAFPEKALDEGDDIFMVCQQKRAANARE
jgi:hypothetical protein